MNELQDRQRYWNDRFKRYGHTGWTIMDVHVYDQWSRLKAVKKILQRVAIYPNETTNVMDIGCGSGDFINEFAQNKAHVTGIDISDEIVRFTTDRFKNFKSIRILSGSIGDIKLDIEKYDLAISITVLQHITDNEELQTAFKNIHKALKEDGCFLLLENIVNLLHDKVMNLS